MRRQLIVFLFVCWLLSMALFVGGAVASHDDESTNFTVVPADRQHGETDVGYTLEIAVTDTFGGHEAIAEPERAIFALEETQLDACEAESGGFEELDHSLYVVDSEADDTTQQALTVEGAVWDGTAVLFVFGDDQPAIAVGKTLVLELDSCVQSPDEPGWYRGLIDIEGTAPDGEATAELQAFSHDFGICDGCTTDDDAREVLGSPPSEPASTPTPTETDSRSDSNTPTRTETPAQTRTETPTQTRTEIPTQAQTSESESESESEADSESEAESSTPIPDPDSTDDGSSEPPHSTPSVGDGSGFGVPVVIVGALFAFALASRRSSSPPDRRT